MMATMCQFDSAGSVLNDLFDSVESAPAGSERGYLMRCYGSGDVSRWEVAA